LILDSKGLFQKIMASKKGIKNPISTVQIIQFEENPKVYNWILDESELEIGSHLGSGRFGTVYKGTFRQQTVAIKVLDNMTQRDVILKEFEIMSSMRSPHIVYFYGMVTKPSIYLVMQYCTKGSLQHVIRNRDFNLDWDKFFKWSKQLVEGVRDLHGWKPCIIHRDLKPANVLVDENDNVYISDFGVSRFVVEFNISTLSKLRGTYAYSAPEVYFGEQATIKADVFSIGIILWELVNRLITGDYLRPYKEYTNLVLDFQIIVQVAKNSLRPTIPTDCPTGLASLITKCWSSNHSQRPTCTEILASLAELKSQYNNNTNAWKEIIKTSTIESSVTTYPINMNSSNCVRRPSAVEDLYIEMKNRQTEIQASSKSLEELVQPENNNNKETQKEEEDSDSE